MERVCFIAELKPGYEDEYKKRHDEIWPEMTEALRDAGWGNFSLFRRELTVIAYAECHPDLETALSSLESTDTNARWSKYVADMFSAARDPFGRLLFGEELWHLD